MTSAERTLLRALSLLDTIELADSEHPEVPTAPRADPVPAAEPARQQGAPGSALEIADRVRRGELDAIDARRPYQRRFAAFEPDLNAFALLTPERMERDTERLREALTAGRRPPLAGVPIGHKDLLDTAGIRTEAGSEALRGRVPERDAIAVRRLRDAGTVLVGKLNTHELATGVTGTVAATGIVCNPWDRSRITGGSSSGSGAAVAAGMVAVATGTDTGGSIRIPAACCGVVGMKPSYEFVDRGGVIPFSVTLDHVGALARNAADLETVLGILSAGATAGATADDPGGAIQGLRVGLPTAWLERARPEVSDAVRTAVGALQRLGAVPVDVDLPDSAALADAAAAAIFLTEGAREHAELLRTRPEALQPPTRELLSLATAVPPARYAQARRLRRRVHADMQSLFDDVALLATPTLPTVAPSIGDQALSLPDGEVDVRAALTRFTRLANLTGLPALSTPCGYHEGLPIGLQIMGPYGADARVLAVARAFETATSWVKWPAFVEDRVAQPGEPSSA